jgi:ATP-dependent RNA helicase RhlB
MKFSELNLNEKLLKGITEAGFTSCMPVQEETLVHTLKGRDTYVQSQTGTGKTAVFLVTIFQAFLQEDEEKRNKKALIITPTRELALQIEKDAKVLGRYLDFQVGCFYGGVGYHAQERLAEKGVDIIVGTPGRLLDFHYQKKIDFSNVGFLVIDEADRLFDMGFLPDIRNIVDSMPRRGNRQTMLFSATMDVRTRAVAREYMKDPIRIEVEPEQVTVDKITQVLYHVAEDEKVSLMLGILKKEMPRSALIFTNMKHTAARVARQLEHNGYKCQYISGDLPQNKRLKAINSFKSGSLPFLVATDVAARGLHIDDLEMIINFDLPGDCENYVHRIGRTARAGKSGKAISLVCENYVYNLEAIEEFIGVKIPVAEADESLFIEDKAAGMDFGPAARRGRGGSHDKEGRKKSAARGKSRKKPGDRKRSDRPERSETERKQKAASSQKKKKKSRPDDHKEQADRRHPAKKQARPKNAEKGKGKPRGKDKPRGKKSENLEDRLEYYRKKYGDSFKVQPEIPVRRKPPAAPPRKESLLKKITGIFKRKK